MSLSKPALPLSLLAFFHVASATTDGEHYDDPSEFDVTIFPTASFSPTFSPTTSQIPTIVPSAIIYPSSSPSTVPTSTGSTPQLTTSTAAPTVTLVRATASSANSNAAIGISLGVGGFVAIVAAVILQKRRLSKAEAIPQAYSDDSQVEV